MSKTKGLQQKAAPAATKVSIPSAPLWHMGKVAALESKDSLTKLQTAIDHLTAKAKLNGSFTKDEKEFLKEIYEALWWGGTYKGYPEAAALAYHYVRGNGEELKINAEVYATSVIVQAVQTVMKQQIVQDLQKGTDAKALMSNDPRLHKRQDYKALFRNKGRKADTEGYLVDDGVLLTEQNNKRLKNADNRFRLGSVSQPASDGAISTTWRVDSYYDFAPFAKASHVTHIPLASKKTLLLPDGLSHYMVSQGIAQEFKYYAEWREIWKPSTGKTSVTTLPKTAAKKVTKK